MKLDKKLFYKKDYVSFDFEIFDSLPRETQNLPDSVVWMLSKYPVCKTFQEEVLWGKDDETG